MITYYIDQEQRTYYVPWGWVGWFKHYLRSKGCDAHVRLEAFRGYRGIPYVLVT